MPIRVEIDYSLTRDGEGAGTSYPRVHTDLFAPRPSLPASPSLPVKKQEEEKHNRSDVDGFSSRVNG